MGDWKIIDSDGSTVLDFEDDLSFRVLQWIGTGMPPMRNIIQNTGFGDGAIFQTQVADSRQIVLTGFAQGATASALHDVRQGLVDVIKRDRATTFIPLELRYTALTTTVRIYCYYSGGLEMNQWEANTEQIALTFIATDPFWYETTESNTALTVRNAFTTVGYLLQRDSSYNWIELGSGLNGAVYDAAKTSNGDLYVVGNFTTAGGGGAVRIAKWDGASWSALGSGLDANVFSIAVDVSDDIYVVGSFANAGGGAAANVAKWDGASWSALGSGLDGTARKVIIAPNGDVVVTGDFNNAGGSAAAKIASWDGSAWSALGSGLNSGGYSLAYDLAGNLIAGGLFTTPGTRAASWDGATWTGMGSINSNGYVAHLAVSSSNTIYASWAYTAGGGTFSAGLYKWTGAEWQTISDQASTWLLDSFGASQKLGIENGVLYTHNVYDEFVLGQYGMSVYTQGGLLSIINFVNDTGGPVTTTAFLYDDDEITLGFNSAPDINTEESTTVNNTGTASVLPVVTFAGPGDLHGFSNGTTNKRIEFMGLTLLTNEVLTVDLGEKTVNSNFRGSLLHKVEQASDFEEFELIPGNNNIVAFVDHASAAGTITWTDRHWSIDGGNS